MTPYGKHILEFCKLHLILPDIVGQIGVNGLYKFVRPSTWYIRKEPKASSKELSVVEGGTTVGFLDEKQNGWRLVYYKGTVGWISEKGAKG